MSDAQGSVEDQEIVNELTVDLAIMRCLQVLEAEHEKLATWLTEYAQMKGLEFSTFIVKLPDSSIWVPGPSDDSELPAGTMCREWRGDDCYWSPVWVKD